jgi:cytochrome c-type biogenesis protein
VVGTLGFILGFSAVFVSYGALFGGLGAELLAHQDVITRVLGVVVIILGLGFLGLVPSLQREARLHHRPARGIWGAPLLGALFAVGWTPCIGPTLAAVQSLAFTEGSAARGALLSVAYCIGLGLPFLVIGLAMERGLEALAWARRNTRAIQIVGGASMILLGVLMVTGLWGSLTIAMRGWVSGFEVPL